MRYLYIFLMLMGVAGAVHGQQTPVSKAGKGVIRGTVIDSTTGKPLREASVSLLQARDSSYLAYTISDGDGNFLLRNVAPGRYRLLVTYVGYENGSRLITTEGASTDAGTIRMNQKMTTLNEVTVVQERAPITVKQDTLEFNANSFKTQPNAAVEDLLKKLPGVEVSRDGTIKAQGQTVNKVLVDGKPFFGNDPKMATRNLPADVIDKVQMYDQQSDQSSFSGIDDGNRERTINLTTKRDKRKGYFGRNSLGGGTNDRYQANLNLNRFNNGRQMSLVGMGNNLNNQGFTAQDGAGINAGGGLAGGGGGSFMVTSNGGGGGGFGGNQQPTNITSSKAAGMNFRDGLGKKAEVAASYFINDVSVRTEQTSRRQNILPAQTAGGEATANRSFLTNQALTSTSRNTNHRFNMRLDWKLDSLTSLRFTPNVSYNGSRFNSLTNQEVQNQSGAALSRNTTDYGMNGNGLNGMSNILLMRKFMKEGRTFSANLNTVLNQQDTRGINQATNLFFGGTTGDRMTRINQQNEQGNNVWAHNLMLSFTEPLSLSKKLELRYNFANNLNLSSREVNDFDEVTGFYSRRNALLSNNFRNEYQTHRIGTTLQNRRLRYTYSLGFDVQQASLQGTNRTTDTTLNRSFTNLLPVGMFSYNWTRNRTLRINYRTRINAPSVSQLQPVPDNTNPLQIRLGNAGLRPEYYNTLSMTYNTYRSAGSQSFFAMMNVNQVNDRIVNSTSFNASGVQTTQPVNADGYYAVNSYVSFGRRLMPWKINLNLNTNLGFSRGIGFVNGQTNYSRNMTLGQGLSLNSAFNGKFEFGLMGNVTYQRATYSLQSAQNNAFFTNMADANIHWQLPFRFVLTTDVLYLNNMGRSAGYNQNVTLWNAGIARQFFKNKQGELKLQVYDLLNQNKSIIRNVTDTYVEDVQNRILRRYFLLSFTYNLRKFGV